jgi:hypothetical protein
MLGILLALGSLVPLAPGAQETRPPRTPDSSTAEPDRGGAPRQELEVRLNGRTVLRGVRLDGDPEVFVRVSDLIVAIDGAADARDTRVRLSGRNLHGVAEGACPGCVVAVRRPVLISSAVRMIAREPYIPLRDLVRAFEGRLEPDSQRGGFDIFAGTCSWCVLEPRGGG